MADRIFVIRGSPALIPGFGGMSPQMIEDLLAISEIRSERIEALAVALEAEPGFPNADRLSEIVREAIDDDRQASAVVAALHHVPPQRVDQFIQTVRDWREADNKNAERFPEEALVSAEQNFRRLTRDFPALERCRKARRLGSILGNTAESLELICDLRPVFDAQRDLVEGIMPLTTMKIVYEGQDQEVRVLEVQLSRDMLAELVEKAQKAQQKLQVLERSIPTWTPNGLVDLG